MWIMTSNNGGPLDTDPCYRNVLVHWVAQEEYAKRREAYDNDDINNALTQDIAMIRYHDEPHWWVMPPGAHARDRDKLIGPIESFEAATAAAVLMFGLTD